MAKPITFVVTGIFLWFHLASDWLKNRSPFMGSCWRTNIPDIIPSVHGVFSFLLTVCLCWYSSISFVFRDADGCTPFMAAVRGRSYYAGITLFTTAQCLARNESGEIDRNVLMSMVYPTDSHPDTSPMHMLCCNDTCSFTWTGTEHINQDIFECRTCGLTGSLCCCTECARVCHRGHDCK